MISAVSSQGKVRFMIYQDTMNQQRLIQFMERLIRTSKQKVFLILDNLKVHHGKLAAAWLERHKDKMEVFFLPPYAPEYNPDEYLNHALKISVHSGQLPYTVGDVTILLKKGRGGGKIKRTVEGDKNGHGKSKVSILWE